MKVTKLVIAEKRELASAIYDAIPGAGTHGEGTMAKGDYLITWCSGHLLRLKMPEEYNPAYKEWKMEDLPIYFPHWEQTIGDSGRGMDKGARVELIGELLKQCSEVIHAGDCDDEGQLIVDEVLRWHNYQGPVYRLDTSDTTEGSLRRALNHLRDNSEVLQREGWSAYARSVSDAVVGFNVTRAMTVTNHAKLTVGRVQTPTLGLVVNRDALIEGHHKVTYFEVFTHVKVEDKDVLAKYTPPKDDPNLDDGRILSKEYAQSIANKLQGMTLNPIEISKKTVMENPSLPFNLIKLQVYCSSHFGYDNVMEITQSLRDKYKAITYNRSDCRYLGDEHFREAPNTVRFVLGNTGMNPAGLDTSIRSRCFDQSKISAHFAIIPTAKEVDLSVMTEQERNVYNAIAVRYLMQFLPPAEKLRTSLRVNLDGGAYLSATSTEIIKPGFRILANGDDEIAEDEKSGLSTLAAGSYKGLSEGLTIAEKETKPPPRYTVASLKEDMTRISKYVTDPEAKRLLIEKDKEKEDENGSIGTTATRDMIVSNLIQNGFLELQKKSLISTPKGRELYRVMPDEFRLADTTAKWWAIQESIKEGTATADDLITSVLDTVKRFLVNPIPKIDRKFLGVGMVVGKCPVCGGDVIAYNKVFACSNFKNDGTGCRFMVGRTNPKFTPLAGVTLKNEHMEALLQGKKMRVKGIPKKDGDGTYDADIAIGVSEDRGAKWLLSFPEKEILGTCPLCGGNIIAGRTGYGCTNWKQKGCKFYVPFTQEHYKPLSKHKITPANMKSLLAGKKIRVKNIPRKSGEGTYEADFSLKIDDKGLVGWDMQLPQHEPLGKCPFCGGDVIEGRTGYGCSNWKEKNCRFYIARDQSRFPPLAKHKITPADMKKLLAGKPIHVTKIPKKSGDGTYSAYFYLEIKDGKTSWKMEFSK